MTDYRHTNPDLESPTPLDRQLDYGAQSGVERLADRIADALRKAQNAGNSGMRKMDCPECNDGDFRGGDGPDVERGLDTPSTAMTTREDGRCLEHGIQADGGRQRPSLRESIKRSRRANRFD